MTVLSAALLLFLVLDPIGNIPVFVCALKSVPAARHRSIIARELCIALGVLMLFLFAGRYVLLLLQISDPALSIAGAVVLFLIALKMIFTGSEDIFRGDFEGEPFVVPLAVPMVAGPSAMTTVMLLMAREPARWPHWLAALLAAWLASGAILLFSDRLAVVLGKRAMMAFERLMGLLLTTVAVQMFITGIKETLGHLSP